jgi:osmotically-inducible protein OsmY
VRQRLKEEAKAKAKKVSGVQRLQDNLKKAMKRMR